MITFVVVVFFFQIVSYTLKAKTQIKTGLVQMGHMYVSFRRWTAKYKMLKRYNMICWFLQISSFVQRQCKSFNARIS